MNRIWAKQSLIALLLTGAGFLVGPVANASAETVGAGIGILSLPGANNTWDTPSNGTNDQSRQNIDI